MGRSLTALAVDSRGVAQRDEKKGTESKGAPSLAVTRNGADLNAGQAQHSDANLKSRGRRISPRGCS